MGETIKSLRLERHLNQEQFAKKFDVAPSAVGMWENDKRVPNEDTKQAIADYFNVDMNYLYGKTPIRNSYRDGNFEDIAECFIKLPLYNPICCGNGGFVDDNVIEYISIPAQMLKPNKHYFANYAFGDSMVGENIKDNDLIIFEKADTIENGQIGCFCVNDEDAMCKVYRCDAKTGLIMLLPANNEFAPITVSPDVDSFRVIGKLALVINDRQDK